MPGSRAASTCLALSGISPSCYKVAPCSAGIRRGQKRGGWYVRKDRLSRRDVLRGSAAVAATAPAAFATRVLAQAPAAEAITPELVEEAKREGKLSFYTAMDIPVAERFAKTFEARFPGISVRVERSGSERIYQRIDQERGSNIS